MRCSREQGQTRGREVQEREDTRRLLLVQHYFLRLAVEVGSGWRISTTDAKVQRQANSNVSTCDRSHLQRVYTVRRMSTYTEVFVTSIDDDRLCPTEFDAALARARLIAAAWARIEASR